MKALFVWILSLALSLGMAWAERSEKTVESIALTVAPSYGVTDELVNSVVTLPAEYGSILLQSIRQKSGTVLSEMLRLPRNADLAAVTALLDENNFWSMPEYLETGVMDGDFVWITVTLEGGETKRVGGLLAAEEGPEEYIAISEAISYAVEHSVEYPLWLLGENPPQADAKNGISLFAFLENQALVEHLAAELPVRATVCYSNIGGGIPYATENKIILRKLMEALAGITVFDADAGMHTDDYLDYSFEWADGTAFAMTFQKGKLIGVDMGAHPVAGFEGLLLAFPPILDLE